MAFRLAKASGVRVPDLVDHIPAALETSEVENGVLVMITGGEIDLWTTGNDVAGILVSDYGDSSYPSPTSKTYSSTFIDKDQVTFLPVTGTLLIEADVDTTATGDLAIGVDYAIDTDGLVDADDVTAPDFRVVRLITNDAGDTVKVHGFFINPGYFPA